MKRVFGVVLLLCLLSFPLVKVNAASYSVSNCNDSGTGSLRQAIQDASNGDTVIIPQNLGCSQIQIQSTLEVNKNITLSGPGAATLAIVGNGSIGDLQVDNGVNVSISNLAIDNGVSNQGAAIKNLGNLTVTDCNFTNNYTGNNPDGGNGGTVFNNGNLNINNSIFTYNGSLNVSGGAIDNYSGSVDINNSTFSHNSGYFGGAILNDQYAAMNITNSTFLNNSSSVYGGAIFSYDSTLNLNNSTIGYNSTSSGGGGIYVYGGGNMQISNSTIFSNTANEGGGIFSEGNVTIANSTVANNIGGGILSSSQNDTIEASIVSNNTNGNDCTIEAPNGITDNGYNLDSDGSCGFSTAKNDIIATNPKLDPNGLQKNGGPTQTVALLPNSPVIGGVNSEALCSTPDQRGIIRPFPCDIGAYEFKQSQVIIFNTAPPSNAVVGGPSYTVTATGSASGIPVVLTIDPTSEYVCGISGSTVTFIGAGVCNIDANQAGNSNYAPAVQVQQAFKVVPPSKCILISPNKASSVKENAFNFVIFTNVCSPWPTITTTKLPTWLAFTDYGNGYATLYSNSPKKGIFKFTITVNNGVSIEKQKFVLNIK